ncbi:hypothetical protein [Paraglaciecola sp.]|uniref:hypothetical protein n=1 Tax=Paraglaciecola sp. TaxID=1920173 RepID=UPI0032653C56
MRVSIVELRTRVLKELSIDCKIEVKDDAEYQIIIEVEQFNEVIITAPTLSLGDVSLPLSEGEHILGSTLFKTKDKGSFYDKAIFLNYFGECELAIVFNDSQLTYLFDVNITSHKANIAKDIVRYLSSNSEDILQSCYSKSRTGYDYKQGTPNKLVKMKALEDAISQLESAIPKFRFNRKHDIESRVEFHSSKPPVFSDRINDWLFDNVDEVAVANSNDYSFKLSSNYVKVELPNSINVLDTDKKENHVIHYFVRTAQKFLRQELDVFRVNFVTANQLDSEYEGYIKFDNVIKSSLKDVYQNQEKIIVRLLSKLNFIQGQINKYLPVRKVKAFMPQQTSYSLRHKHYLKSFESIKIFYLAESANKQKESFLLGLRNLSQLFEFACLYYLVNYLRRFSTLIEVDWVKDSYSLIGSKKEEVNVLGNYFVFENDNFTYTLFYEKKFYALTSSSDKQLDNLIRVDRGASYFEPDFTLKVEDKISGEYYFVILDAKFSRKYKMSDRDDSIGILSSIFLKYGNGLKVYSNNGIESLTKFVGVMFGLKKQTDNTRRLTYYDPKYDIDSELPILPFASADFIDFSSSENPYYEILDKYIKY